METVKTQLRFLTMANCTQSKKVFEEWVNRVDTRIKPSMMIADITNTGGLVLLKNRTCRIFILDSIEEIQVNNRIYNVKILRVKKIF